MSELSGPTGSAASIVTPRCRADKVLRNRSMQCEDWGAFQTPSPPSKKRETEVLSLAESLKMSFEAAQKEPVKGELPEHAAQLKLLLIYHHFLTHN